MIWVNPQEYAATQHRHAAQLLASRVDSDVVRQTLRGIRDTDYAVLLIALPRKRNSQSGKVAK